MYRRTYWWLLMISFLFLLSCDDDDTLPTSPEMPSVAAASASFRILGAGYDQTLAYRDGANQVFCNRNAGWADLWLRFGEQPGDGNPHIDIDLCNYTQGGSFAAMDPNAATCGDNPTWDIWWHDNGTVFNNAPTGGGCRFDAVLNAEGTRLSGSFSCSGLGEVGGTRRLDILDGSFQCPVL